MALFDYRAIHPQGKRITGTLEAASEREAKEKLREQKLMIVDLLLKSDKKSRQSLKGDDLVSFTALLAQLLASGIPLYEGLLAIEEQFRTERFHSVILSLSEQIKRGSSLSEAMAHHSGSFDRLYCAMVAAGEAVGMLDKVLEKLGQFLAKQLKLKKQLMTAMIYPAVLGAFSCVIILVLLCFVVPSIEAIFEGRKLNGFTRLVLAASSFFRSYWWLLLLAGAAGGAFSYYKLKTQAGVERIQRVLLKLPLIKTVVIQASVGRFCRTMATLQQGGVTVIEALRIARGVMRNVVLEREMLLAEERVIEGSSLSQELARSQWMPQLVPRMLSIGEESGTTVEMFNRIADLYEDELEKTLERVMALAQPLILIVMGGVIGLVLLAILLPLADVSSLTGM